MRENLNAGDLGSQKRQKRDHALQAKEAKQGQFYQRQFYHRVPGQSERDARATTFGE